MMIIQTYDISKFFDKERVEDAVLTCLRRKADPKAVRLWYHLNADTRIRVKTGAGMSEWGEVGAVLGQGTMGGALISQAVLDSGVSDHFTPGGQDEVQYGGVPLQPLMFQDDLIHGANTVEQARVANNKMEKVMREKGLALNQRKTNYLIMGSRRQVKEARVQMEERPLTCGSFTTNEQQVEKWLGQYISSKGLADSVAETVAAREGKIRGAAMEILDIVNDWRARAAGGLEVAIMLWERCCVPSDLYGAGTWVNMPAGTLNKLNKLQNWFLRMVLQVGQGAPLPPWPGSQGAWAWASGWQLRK